MYGAYRLQSIIKGSHHTNSRQELRGRNCDGGHRGMLFTCLHAGSCQLPFLYSQAPSAQVNPTHIGMDLSTSIKNQENVSTDMPTGQSDKGNSFIEVLS